MVPNLGLAPGLIIIGVFAPVCEELLFRGVLARSLETRFRRPAAIAISALAFALAHESPYRLFAPLLIGAIAAYVTLRSRSVVPAIVLHALNNTILVLHSHVVSGTFTRWTLAHLDALIAPAVALVLAGVAISRVGEG
jgi:membrane protease YdiL (CAAX protease family)